MPGLGRPAGDHDDVAAVLAAAAGVAVAVVEAVVVGGRHAHLVVVVVGRVAALLLTGGVDLGSNVSLGFCVLNSGLNLLLFRSINVL